MSCVPGIPGVRESRDPWVHRVLRDYLEIMDLKDPWVQVGARVMQVLLESRAPQAPRDHSDPRVKLERRVIQVIKVPRVPREIQDR